MIDAETEAQLGFLGAVHDLPVAAGVTMDVGGGSVELTRFEDRRPGRSWTVPFGSLRVSDRFLDHDPPTTKEIGRLRHALDRGPRRRRRHRTPQARGRRGHRRDRPQPGEGGPATDRRRDAPDPRVRAHGAAPGRDDRRPRRALDAAAGAGPGPQPRPRRHDRRRRPRGARGDGARRGSPARGVEPRDPRGPGPGLVRPLGAARVVGPDDLGRSPSRAGSRRGTPGSPNAGRRSSRKVFDALDATSPLVDPRDARARRDARRHRPGDRLLRPVRARRDDRAHRRPRRVLPRGPGRARDDPARRGRRRLGGPARRRAGPRRRGAGGRRRSRSPRSCSGGSTRTVPPTSRAPGRATGSRSPRRSRPAWRPRAVADRFAAAVGRPLRIVADGSGT